MCFNFDNGALESTVSAASVREISQKPRDFDAIVKCEVSHTKLTDLEIPLPPVIARPCRLRGSLTQLQLNIGTTITHTKVERRIGKESGMRLNCGTLVLQPA